MHRPIEDVIITALFKPLQNTFNQEFNFTISLWKKMKRNG